MTPPRYPPEDRFSHTVEDASAYEVWRAGQAGELDHQDPDAPDDDEEDPCRCSDPGCPCGGPKSGAP